MFRILLSVCIWALFASSIQAKVIKVATEYPDGNSVLNELRAAGERIKDRTQGSVTFKFYPSGVMGDGLTVQRKIRAKQLQGTFIHSGALANNYKNSQVLNAPLLFRSFDEVDIVRAQFDEEINQGFIDSGWVTFGLIEGGFAYAMSSVPVSNLDDLRKQKLWLPANDPFSAKIAKAFNINPISLNIGDVLAALQTGAIDAFVAPPVGAITLQWYSKANYLTEAPFMYTYGVIALSPRALNGIPDVNLEILKQELSDCSKKLDSIARIDNLKAFDALNELGIQSVQLDAQSRAAIEREAMQANQKLIKTHEFDEELYLRIMSVLTEYRDGA